MVSLLAFTSCASEYKIEGSSSVSRLDGKMLFVKVPSGDQMLSIDSAEVIHGMFKMEGITDSTSMASLYMDDESIMPFVIEKGKISISIDNARIVVTGTPLNDRLYDFVGKKTSLDDRAYELERQESRMIMDGKAPDEIQREITREREKLAAEMNALAKEFIQKNYDNVLGPGVFIMLCRMIMDGKAPDEIQREITREREKLAAEMNALAKEFIQKNYDNVLGPGVFIMLCSNFPYPVMTPLIEEIIEEAPDRFKNNSLVKDYVTVARSNMEKLKVPH